VQKIKLSKGEFALVDDKDFEWLNKYKWFAVKFKNSLYAKRNDWSSGKNKPIWMHREILKKHGIDIQGKIIDHKDRNGLNNQSENLRLSTSSENHQNWHRIKGKSKYKGVYWHKQRNKWCASIMLRYKHISLGLFESEKLAAVAYNIGALIYFGQFAHLNDF